MTRSPQSKTSVLVGQPCCTSPACLTHAPLQACATPEKPKANMGIARPFLEGNELAEEAFGFLQSKTYM